MSKKVLFYKSIDKDIYYTQEQAKAYCLKNYSISQLFNILESEYSKEQILNFLPKQEQDLIMNKLIQEKLIVEFYEEKFDFCESC